MTRKDDEDLEDSTKCRICDNNNIVDGDVKVRDHCHSLENIDFLYIEVKLTDKVSTVLHSINNFDLHLIMQKLGKFDFQINVIQNGLKKYMSFNINNNLISINSFEILPSLLDSLVKNQGKDDFKYLSKEFDGKVLDLVKEKWFYHYEYMSGFERFKEELSTEERISDRQKNKSTGKKISDKIKTIKDYHDLRIKFDVLLLADVFEKFRDSNLKSYGLSLSHYLSAKDLS